MRNWNPKRSDQESAFSSSARLPRHSRRAGTTRGKHILGARFPPTREEEVSPLDTKYLLAAPLAGWVALSGCAARHEAGAREGAVYALAAPAMAGFASMARSSKVMAFDEAPVAPAREAAPANARLLVRDGSVNLASARIDETLDSAEALAVRLGGYVQSRSAVQATLRVPVARFDEAFAAVQRLGRLLGHSQSAQDVTGEVQDLDLKIRIQERLLDKLQELLVKESDAKRRQDLLREIQGTAETLERLRRRRDGLAKLAAFSTLDVTVQAARTGLQQDDLAAFAWIGALQARREDDRSPRGKRLRLAAPEGMVELPRRDSRREWMAASADGAEFRARRLPNVPRGDARFWREALRLRLAPGFASCDTLALGSWLALRLRADDPTGWTWWIAVQTRGKRLYLAQAFYPDSALEQAGRPALERALSREDRP